MALGLAGVSKSYGPFAAALTFGLMVAMFGTLFAVPLSYTSLIVLQERLRRRFSRRAAPAVAPVEGGGGDRAGLRVPARPERRSSASTAARDRRLVKKGCGALIAWSYSGCDE